MCQNLMLTTKTFQLLMFNLTQFYQNPTVDILLQGASVITKGFFNYQVICDTNPFPNLPLPSS